MVYERLQDYDKAMDYYMKSLEMNLELGDKNWLSNNYGNIGSLYLLMGKKESLDYFTRRLEINRQQKDTSGIANSMNLIGNYYFSTNISEF